MNGSQADCRYGLAVRAMISNEKGECLILKRRGDITHFPDRWEWPGGKVDPGESFDQALVREVKEETGLSISLHRVVGAYEFMLDDLNIAVLCMEGGIIEGNLALSDEHADSMWIDPYQMLKLELTDCFREFLMHELSERELSE